MKFVVMDTYGYFGNIMPRNHFVKDISEIYKTQKIQIFSKTPIRRRNNKFYL